MTTEIQKIEAGVENEGSAIWAAFGPKIISLGETGGSQVLQAVETWFATGGNMAVAIASVVAQLPADLESGEAIVAGMFGMVASTMTPPATSAPAPTPAAPAA